MENRSSASPEQDITIKYQKLASEYSKLRTNTSVLKRAVADEQSKCTELRDNLKEKDQAVRKLEQEIECLNFRNVQLSKRVRILQEDLQTGKEKTSKKNKSKSTTVVPLETQNILDAELSNRIEENEKLHHQVYSAEVEHKKIVDDLTEQLERLKFDSVRQQETFNETIVKQDSVIKKLTEERAKMEVQMKSMEKDLGEIKEQEHSGMEEMKKTEDELHEKLKSNSTILYEKLPFVDCHRNQLKKYNIKAFVRKHWERVLNLLQELGSLLSDFVRKLSDLHMYTEQQVRLTMDDAGPEAGVFTRLLRHLGEHVLHLKSIDKTYQTLLSHIVTNVAVVWTEGFQCTEFVNAVGQYVQYLRKLLPYVLLYLETKVSLNSNITRVSDAFRALQIIATKLVNAFSVVEKWLAMLVNSSYLKQTYGVNVGFDVIVQKLLGSVQRLLDCLSEARTFTSTKIAVESQLPTVTVEMRTTDECILSCLVSLFNLLGKMLKLAKSNSSVFENGVIGLLGNGAPCHSSTIRLKERGAKYVALLQDVTEEGVPYTLALENQRSMVKFREMQEVAEQKLAFLETKFSKAEQDKEHWLLEYQLLQAKQKREHGGDVLQHGAEVSQHEMEACVKTHIHKLLCRLQMADSKAVAFESEFHAARQTLHILEMDHEDKSRVLEETRTRLEGLKETHQATVNNYEEQLATMSEHLANMNEKLSSQKDEIDSLRQNANKKSKGK